MQGLGYAGLFIGSESRLSYTLLIATISNISTSSSRDRLQHTASARSGHLHISHECMLVRSSSSFSYCPLSPLTLRCSRYQWKRHCRWSVARRSCDEHDRMEVCSRFLVCIALLAAHISTPLLASGGVSGSASSRHRSYSPRFISSATRLRFLSNIRSRSVS